MRKSLALLLFFGLVGCVTAGQQMPNNPIKNSEVVNQPFDKVWSAVITTVSERGLPIITTDKNSGLISTQSIQLQGGFNIPSRIQRVAYFNFKVVPFHDARYSLNIVVSKETDETTKIVVTPHIEGDNYEKWITFQSKGIIEQEIIQAVKNKL